MNGSYSILKEFYSHEKSIHQEDSITGTVYTPNVIARQMIYYLLKNHIEQNLDAFMIESVNFDAIYIDVYLHGNVQSQFQNQAVALINVLLPLKILDLSCGSGVLLIAYIDFIDFLIQYSKYDKSEILQDLISNKIYGIDIDAQALMGFEQILAEFALANDFVLNQTHLHCANSLLEPLPIKDVQFDLIIGNPPYIGEKNNLEWFRPIKATEFGMSHYEGKMDYFYFFIYKGFELLKENGSLCYLSSNYFLTADGAMKLRRFIKDDFNISYFIDYGDKRIFPDRKLHACAYVLQKNKKQMIQVYDDAYHLIKAISTEQVNNSDGTFKFIISDNSITILNAMVENKLTTLGKAYTINQGIVSGSDKQFVYHIDEQLALPDPVKSYLVPFYKNSDVKHFYTNDETPLSLLYVDRPDVAQELIDWLKPFESKLSKRREVIKNIRAWYTLTWPRTQSIFTSEKIVVPQRARTNRFAYSSKPFYASADVYFITSNHNSPYSLKVLTLILNASLYFHWLTHMGKRKGNLLELYATPLKEIPIPVLEASVLAKFTEWGTELYDSGKKLEETRIAEIMSEVELLLRSAFKIDLKAHY